MISSLQILDNSQFIQVLFGFTFAKMFKSNFIHTLTTDSTAAVAQWARAFAPQAEGLVFYRGGCAVGQSVRPASEGWVFESQPRPKS